MHWSDQAILLSAHKFNESGAVVRVFTEDHGIYAGAVRGAFSKKHRATFESGNLVKADWSARLSEHLGSMRCELLQAMPAFFMNDASKLMALQSSCSLIDKCFAERDPHPALYRAFWSFLQEMKFGGNWLQSYVKLELLMLCEAGFRLELEKCAATGLTQELIYVSPKSGRAVCAAAGELYKDRLLPLPDFLAPSSHHPIIQLSDLLDGLRLTGYFLEHRVLTPESLKMPAARARLAEQIDKKNTSSPCVHVAESTPETNVNGMASLCTPQDEKNIKLEYAE